jgi:hypothetical protein
MPFLYCPAAEVASAPAADITIYCTLVDRDFVLLH